MSTTKLNPKSVLKIAKDIRPKVNTSLTAIDDLYQSIKNCSAGNEGKSYWNGNRAHNWYCSAARNCANAYYRVYKIASCYASMCKSAQDAIMKDDGMQKSERSTYDSLHTNETKFKTLMSDCETKRNALLSWAQGGAKEISE